MSSRQDESIGRSKGNRWVRPSVPEDAPAIIALMRQAGLDPHVESVHLHWKYWRERPDWPGSRSFVLTNGSDLLAHGAVVPGILCWGAQRARVVHMIDWAARREALGARVTLLRHIAGLADFLLGILGRPVRPAWKQGPRIVRSALWCWSAPRPALNGWTARRIETGELEQLHSVLPTERSGITVVERSAALFRHVLACPIVPVELFVLERNGQTGGYFLLSYAPGQARLADAWMLSEDPADWWALAHAAVQQAQCRGGMAELALWASDCDFAQILRAAGFQERLSLPIYLRPSVGESVPSTTPRVQMIDNDAYYLHFGGNELWA